MINIYPREMNLVRIQLTRFDNGFSFSLLDFRRSNLSTKMFYHKTSCMKHNLTTYQHNLPCNGTIRVCILRCPSEDQIASCICLEGFYEAYVRVQSILHYSPSTTISRDGRAVVRMHRNRDNWLNSSYLLTNIFLAIEYLCRFRFTHNCNSSIWCILERDSTICIHCPYTRG